MESTIPVPDTFGLESAKRGWHLFCCQLGMDIPRAPKDRSKTRLALLLAVVFLLGGLFLAVYNLEPAAPTVERAGLWIDTVTRGPFVREVRGNGTLVPEVVRWVAAPTNGQVEQILLQPGAVVLADTLLIELTNVELESRAREAELQAKAAQADLAALRVGLEREVLDVESVVATVASDAQQAKLLAEANEELAQQGLVSALQTKISRVRADELAIRHDLELRRKASATASVEAKEAAQVARVAQLQETAELLREQVQRLNVRAGIPGVLQSIEVEPGQQIIVGASLARVSDPARLKAELRVPETQARDISVGLLATIDTRNGKISGRVSRIDPAVIQGTVLVDIRLEGELPKGARPDLSIDGLIEIERLDDTLSVGRPPIGEAGSTISLFKISADGSEAKRTRIRLGRGSATRVEVLEGLAPGDKVILSDMSEWDSVDRIQLE